MALQHFYSRVPARVSMYNKADGFDTFAQSAQLEQAFVKGELAPIYENKLHKNDLTAIRQDKMPCVYLQNTTRSGITVQNCIRYLPVDYTGERSAYLSHALILTEEEKNKILSTRSADALNPDLFETDIDRFRITDPNGAPNGDLPAKDFLPKEDGTTSYLLAELNEDTVESLLYALLYSICGKGRNVCVRLPGEGPQLSLRAVRLFNELLSIFPNQIRTDLSFVSYVTDPTQYSNYKLRGVSSEFPEAAAKCVFIDLQTNLIVGVQHDEVVANRPLIGFFASLAKNATLRAEFLAFMERAGETISGLQNMSLKVLGNLVFLFQCTSDQFSEQEIMPTDASVLEYLCAYEKYRNALNEDYRARGYRCLQRYPENHVAIPKNIFAKVCRLYPTEASSAKNIVMNVVLNLIHTDVMRDKLFTFIRNNYRTEDADMQKTVITDLCRVFYGGFLQSQLLTFFSEQFAEESEESRSLILEKLLLSIRTPAVQNKIIAFIDQHYDSFTEEHKNRFYGTFLEMLPECDALADALIKTANRHLSNESDERKKDLENKLLPLLESDCRRKERQLMPLLANHSGFCRDLVIRQVFGPWKNWKVHGEYLELLSKKTAGDKTETLHRIFESINDPNLDELLPEVIELFRTEAETGDLYLWLDIADRINELPQAFADRLHEELVEPAVCQRACEVFHVDRSEDGMTLLETYATLRPKVRECDQYLRISEFNRMVTAAVEENYPEVNRHLSVLLQNPDHLTQMAEHLDKREIHPETQSEEAVICMKLLRSALEKTPAELGRRFRRCAVKYNAEQSLAMLLSVCIPMCSAGPSLEALLTAPNAGHDRIVTHFVNAYGKGAYHHLSGKVSGDTPFEMCMQEAIRAHKKANGSFFSRLFDRKK